MTSESPTPRSDAAVHGQTSALASSQREIVARRQREREKKQRWSLFYWGIPLILFVLIAIFGPLLIDYDPVLVRSGDRLQPPGSVLQDGSRAWLGTDQVGREVFAQVIQGARISMIVGGMTILLAGTLGTIIGVLAGFYGGVLDAVMMRLADIQLAFPSILLAILIVAVLGPSVVNVIITLALTQWVTFGRVARATTLTTKEREFVTAARTIGASSTRLILRHIFPSTIPPLIVIATVGVGIVIIAEASLSFLGLGTPPGSPSWGLVVANGRDYLNIAWWISTIPGLALSMVVLSVGLFGDRIRDHLDPRTVRI